MIAAMMGSNVATEDDNATEDAKPTARKTGAKRKTGTGAKAKKITVPTLTEKLPDGRRVTLTQVYATSTGSPFQNGAHRVRIDTFQPGRDSKSGHSPNLSVDVFRIIREMDDDTAALFMQDARS